MVNKETLKVELLEVLEPENNERLYLLTGDVRSATNNLIIINSESDMSESVDLIRQQELIKSKFNLIGSKVVTQEGKLLGRVKDFTVDYDSFLTSKLHIRGSLIKRLLNESFIIDRSQIVDVKDNKVIVKSTAIKNKQKSTNVLPAKAT
jgi:uncharacterized protein YrrD